jgi:hypothetical protein
VGNPPNPTATSSFPVSGLTQPVDQLSNPNPFIMNQPDDLAQLNTDFGTYELSAGCGMGVVNGLMSEPQPSQAACECGDDCECFACMQHPKNRTTLGYVRYHNDLFMREAQVPQLGFGNGPLHYQMAMNMQQTPQFVTPFGSPPVMDQSVAWPGAANQFTHEQFHFQPRPQTMPPNPEPAYQSSGRPFTPTYAPDPVPAVQNGPAPIPSPPQHDAQQTEPNTPTPADPDVKAAVSDTNSNSGYSPTLSPSAFMLHQYTLPGCDNFYGTCRCGDGCSCDGCLTHSGHDGYGANTAAAAAPGGTAAMDGAADGWGSVFSDHGGADLRDAVTPG